MSQLSGTSISQTIIPGAAQAYQNVLSGMQQGYGALSQNVLGGYGSLLAQGMTNAANYGLTEQAKIQNAYLQQRSQQDQGLLDRGLGNTTIQNSVNTGLLQNEQLNLTNAREQAAGLRNQTLAQFGLPLYGAEAQLGEAGLSAQQQLGQTYLNMLAQQGIHTQQYSQRSLPFFNPFGQGGSISYREPMNPFQKQYSGGGTGYGGGGFGDAIQTSPSAPPSGGGGGFGGYGGAVSPPDLMGLLGGDTNNLYGAGSFDTTDFGGGGGGAVDPESGE